MDRTVKTLISLTKFLATFAVSSSISISLPTQVLASSLQFRLEEATIDSINQAFDAGILDSRQLVQLYLNRINAYDDSGPRINSIISINLDALSIATALDIERRTTGPRSPLHGIPVILKDNYDTFDMPTSAGALAFQNFIPTTDAFQVAKLRDAGAIILAKANLSEFAFSGSTSISSFGGTTVNPYDPLRSPAGSSGGTGAAIAANFGVIGLGTDTGGSIRNPSSFNGLVGVRPTIGLSSRSGIVPLALSQDVGGPMTRTVRDAAITLDFTVGFDANDPITALSNGNIPASYTTNLTPNGLQGIRIGVVRDLFGVNTNPDFATVNGIIDTAIARMTGLGATFTNVTIPNLSAILASPSLSAFEFRDNLNSYLASQPNAPYQTLTEIIASGQFLPSNLNTLNTRNNVGDLATNLTYQDIITNRPTFVRDSLLQAMTGFDALLYPTTIAPPRLNTQGQQTGSSNRLSAFSGFPAVTLPAGFTGNGLPVGMEFLGRAFSEASLLQFAYAYETAFNVRSAPSSVPALPGETIVVPEPSSIAALGMVFLGGITLKLTRKPRL
ncbi:MAG: amidase family protein [Microcystis sp. LE17-20D]|uniref:amidase family protein n=2 Tax=Microcystis sp. TaxID=1127 RepID=UPI0022C97CB9|nr:amidase family protein [Microcystis sp. LE17-20D]MCZ8162728.1 amidase family protein [Microcystis sp. LE19-196.1B]MCZ8272704.1 amidase family protein [Microcystis sp. LE19-4.1E]